MGAGLGGLLGACGIPDCGEDAAKCAEVLNQNAAKCAEAFTLKPMDAKRKSCARAIEVVSEQRAEAAVPGLVDLLSVPESGIHDDTHRSEAARALGKIGSKEAVDGLLAAIDFSVGTSGDPKDKMGNRSNEEIAEALGLIGDPRAVPKLIELMDKTRDNNVALWAMRALGQLGSPEAVPSLGKVALEHDNKFMRKNAVIALGDIGHESAIDTLIQMMFVEYQGVSFYKEASYALFRVGPAAVEPLLETMAMKNDAVNAVFERSGGLKESAVVAKCAVVLGDLRDERAIGPMVDAYEAALKKGDPIVIAQMPFAFGSLASSAAVPILMREMASIDASIREPIMAALNKIGDRRPVAGMIEAMTAQDFIKRCIKEGIPKGQCQEDVLSRARAQKAAADAATFLVDAEHVEDFQKVVEGEELEEVKTYFVERLEAAKLAAECALDVSCWAKKAENKNPLLREKAYWELGRIGGPVAQQALAKGLSDKKPQARAAAIFSYWKLGDPSVVEALGAQIEKETGSADFIRVNEDLKRLYIDLKRRLPS